MLSQVFTLALLAATAICSPVAQASTEPTTTAAPSSTTPATSTTSATSTRTRPTAVPRKCVLTEGPNPFIIDPFTRPDCVCKCYKSACKSLNRGGSYADYVACIETNFGPNKSPSWGTEMIAAFGACTGVSLCPGGFLVSKGLTGEQSTRCIG